MGGSILEHCLSWPNTNAMHDRISSSFHLPALLPSSPSYLTNKFPVFCGPIKIFGASIRCYLPRKVLLVVGLPGPRTSNSKLFILCHTISINPPTAGAAKSPIRSQRVSDHVGLLRMACPYTKRKVGRPLHTTRLAASSLPKARNPD